MDPCEEGLQVLFEATSLAQHLLQDELGVPAEGELVEGILVWTMAPSQARMRDMYSATLFVMPLPSHESSLGMYTYPSQMGVLRSFSS